MKTIIRIALLAAVASLFAPALAPVVAHSQVADWPPPTCWPPCPDAAV